LKRGRQAHWQTLVAGRAHLGYQVWRGEQAGRWIARRYVGARKYSSVTLGRADDRAPADGISVLDYEQAKRRALATIDAPATSGRLTVRQAMENYVAHKRAHGKLSAVADVESRIRAHVLPVLGDVLVADLTTKRLRKWLGDLARSPAQKRPKGTRPQYRAAAVSEEDIRRRRSSANRCLAMFKAILNHAYDEGDVPSRAAWDRKLKGFDGVDQPRIRFLSVAEAQRLLNAADPEFRPLLRAGLETGCRYGELCALEVADFDARSRTLAIRRSKSGRSRHVILTPEGANFFASQVAGRAGQELIFRRADGGAWKKSHQADPMREAVQRARISPAISFHGLRHTWASLSVMAGMPLMVIARNLGHADTTMVQKVYGHLGADYISDAIQTHAPRFAVEDEPTSVVPMPR
jgi:integrase